MFLLTAPAAGAGVLTAVLRGRGFDAIGFDVSRSCVDGLLQRDSIRAKLARIPAGNAAQAALDEALPDTAGHSAALMRDSLTYDDPTLYASARADLEYWMRANARAHGTTRWSSAEYHGDHDRSDGLDLLAAVRRGGELFDGGIEDALKSLAAFRPELVAISVSIPEQLYGALRLGLRIRQCLDGSRVIIGGATATRLRASLKHLPDLFDCTDFVALREGEESLLRVCEVLEAGGDPVQHVPNLLARRDGRVVASEVPVGMPLNLGSFPPPLFEDLVPGSYLTPRPFLPVSTTRNCYYNRCTFCAISRSFNFGFRQMPPDRMVRQIAALAESHTGAVFKDVSEALMPHVLWRFADLMTERFDGAPPAWEAYLRFERPFASVAAAQRLRRGGLAVAYFGLESGSADQVAEVRKSIDLAVARETLRNFAHAGIWNHVFLISGLPRETEADHYATLEFLNDNRPYIHSIQASAFRMELDSDVVGLAERYGFEVAHRAPTSFDVEVKLARRGQIPDVDVAQRRVREIRDLAYEGEDTLGFSRRIWDGHKIMFTLAYGSATFNAPMLTERLRAISWRQ
jgi:hypothetical protein